MQWKRCSSARRGVPAKAKASLSDPKKCFTFSSIKISTNTSKLWIRAAVSHTSALINSSKTYKSLLETKNPRKNSTSSSDLRFQLWTMYRPISLPFTYTVLFSLPIKPHGCSSTDCQLRKGHPLKVRKIGVS